MEFFTLVRPVLSLIKEVKTLFRRSIAERKVLKAPEQENQSLYKVMEKTLVHLGVEPSVFLTLKERWILLLERRIVITEPFTLPHIRQWLNLTEVQEHLKCIAVQKLTYEKPLKHSETILIELYVATTGETDVRAKDIIFQAVTTIITGTLSGLQDPELGVLLKIHSHALHEHIDQLSHRLLPERELSLLNLCSINAQWLIETFSSKNRAKTRLGQALCPGETSPILQRRELQNQLSETLSIQPDGGVIVVTGAEGNGKSWLVAQTWLSLPLKPLTAFIRAEDVEEPCNDIAAIIINALCRSSQIDIEIFAKFWQWQIGIWSEEVNRPVTGIVVILDGINQRPTIRWAQLIDRLSELLQQIGGKLIVTSRQHYFTQFVENKLVTNYKKCFIPEWSSEERDEILALRNIRIIGRQLNDKVAISLCNPRMLGIALDLFNVKQLHDLKDISVSLMLFEHIKASQRDSYELSAELFSKRLREYGQAVLDRFGKDSTDIDVFESGLEGIIDGGLNAVADGRFFIPLPEDSMRYRINPEGLSLALGLAILDIMNKAARNNKDLHEEMASVVEPVMALDKTSDTLFAALTVSCLDSRHPECSGIAILVSFLGLQNLDMQLYSAFIALARRRPEIFFKACEYLVLHNKNILMNNWIEDALIQLARPLYFDKNSLNIAAQWLGWVPSNFIKSSIKVTPDDEETAKEFEKLRVERDEKISKFTSLERDVYDTLIFKETDNLSSLHVLAFKIMAGNALVPYVNELVKWSFAYNLTLSYGAPWQAFRNLITFNAIDWKEVRTQLKTHWDCFVQAETSQTGKWVAINISMATGHSDDAHQAEILAHQLRDNSLNHKGWHINESWCETDPCNPENTEPENVKETVVKHIQLDVKKIYNHYGMGYQENFFSGAAVSLSRYYPKVAVGSYLRLAEDILHRSGIPLRQGIFALLPHRALMTPVIARKLVERVVSTSVDDQSAWLSLENESDLMKQFQLILGFQHLNSHEQLSILQKLGYRSNFLMTLIESLKPLDWCDLEVILDHKLSGENVDEQVLYFLFHPHTGTIPFWLINILPQLLDSSSHDLRNQTLRMLLKVDDPEALSCATQYLISTEKLSLGQQEKRYYSELIFKAIIKKFIKWDEGRSLLNFTHIAQLAGIYGGQVSDYAAGYFDAFINRAFQHKIDVGRLQLTLTLESEDDRSYQFHSLNEVKDSELDGYNNLKVHSNNNIDNFEEHQQSLKYRYDKVRVILSDFNLSELTNNFYPKDVSALIKSMPDQALVWANLFLDDNNKNSLHLVRHIGLVLSQVLSAKHPALSVQLFERLDEIIPFNRVVYTDANIDLSVVAVWSASDSPEINQLRLHRLERAKNNDALAHEVWAALLFLKENFLQQYIHDCCKSSWPVSQAKGIMIAGYLHQNEVSELVLKRDSYSGFLQNTVKSAKDSYQRHLWTLHWFSLMQQASTAHDFWCASRIFLQVVDERFLTINRDKSCDSDVFRLYWSDIATELSKRFQKLRKKRAELLFGDKAPWAGFIES